MSDFLKTVDPRTLRLFTRWARQNNIVRPATDAGIRVLLVRFKAEISKRANEFVFKQFGEDPPAIAAGDPPWEFLQTDGNMIDIAQPETDDSDFTDMMRGRSEALEEAGGDDLAAHVIYRDAVKARINDKIPGTSDAPDSWDKAIFGTTLLVQPAQNTANAGPFQQVVNWPGELRENRPVTITIAPVPTQVSPADPLRIPGNAVSRPVALVQWGTMQGQFQALVDVGSGAMLTISCCSVQVSMGLDGGSTAPMEVYGSMSFGSATHPVPALRTAYADGLLAAGSQVVWRPPFAMSIVGVERSDYTQPITLTYMDLAGNQVGHHIFGANTSLDAPLFLPNDCASILVTNSGNATVNARLTFGLTF